MIRTVTHPFVIRAVVVGIAINLAALASIILAHAVTVHQRATFEERWAPTELMPPMRYAPMLREPPAVRMYCICRVA